VFAENIPYGPTNLNAGKMLDPKRLSTLPTAPENLAKSLQVSSDFWLEHGEDLEQRFNAWAAR
jgi:putative spermidine/putrescine transport system substrate-binding protein